MRTQARRSLGDISRSSGPPSYMQRLTGEKWDIRAKVVINATGPYVGMCAHARVHAPRC